MKEKNLFKKLKMLDDYVPYTIDDYKKLLGKFIKIKDGTSIHQIITVRKNYIETHTMEIEYEDLLQYFRFYDNKIIGKYKKTKKNKN